jgi:hypothetical protein
VSELSQLTGIQRFAREQQHGFQTRRAGIAQIRVGSFGSLGSRRADSPPPGAALRTLRIARERLVCVASQAFICT